MEGLRELLAACVQPFNVPFTFLMVITLLYWLSVILGAVDIDALNIDMDADIDADVDVDVDADVDADAGGGESPGAVTSALRFMNAGEVPLVIILSLFFFSMWVIAILSNHYLNRSDSVLLAAALAVPNVVLSVFVAKYVGSPFRWIFGRLDRSTERHEEILLNVCRVITSQVSSEIGQAEITTDGASLKINVRTQDGQVLKKGDEAMVTNFDKVKNVYTISKMEV